jgi:hypothetical protein
VTVVILVLVLVLVFGGGYGGGVDFYFWGLHPVVSNTTDFLGFRRSQLIVF